MNAREPTLRERFENAERWMTLLTGGSLATAIAALFGWLLRFAPVRRVGSALRLPRAGR